MISGMEMVQPVLRGEVSEKPNASLFESVLQTVTEMTHQQVSSKMLMADVLAGRSENTHGALIELEKAELQMNLATVVRDKTAQAYNQIINMQI